MYIASVSSDMDVLGFQCSLNFSTSVMLNELIVSEDVINDVAHDDTSLQKKSTSIHQRCTEGQRERKRTPLPDPKTRQGEKSRPSEVEGDAVLCGLGNQCLLVGRRPVVALSHRLTAVGDEVDHLFGSQVPLRPVGLLLLGRKWGHVDALGHDFTPRVVLRTV